MSIRERPRWWSSGVVIGVVGILARGFVKLLGDVRVYNGHVLRDAVLARPAGQPLITVSNHTSTVDDPVIWGALLDAQTFLNWRKIRWTLGAKELMFKNRLDSWFFGAGRVIPIVRGAGLAQPGVNEAVRVLDRGQWLHIFPEGKVNKSGELLKLRWGVGKFVATAEPTPLVVPVVHCGMEKIMPGSVFPAIPFFRRLSVWVGEPMYFAERLQELRNAGKSEHEIYMHVTQTVEQELRRMEKALASWDALYC